MQRIKPATIQGSRRGGRRVALLSAAALAASTLVGVLFAAPSSADAATAATTPPTATQQAEASGEAVEVKDLTTGTEQVMAEPDGTFQLTSYRMPVRVQRAGQWVPIDTRLVANADGTFSPAATDAQLRFSGGGSGPALVMGDPQSDASVSISWPGGLPVPTVEGDTATYAGVLPGTDLVLTARDESYSETIVVHDAQAAANPDLQNLHLTFAANGVKLSKDAEGVLDATDSSGAQVFSGTTPVAWDSSYDPHVGTVPNASDPGGSATDAISLSMPTVNGTSGSASATATVQTPPSLLIGPDVHYPVYIDPTLTWGGPGDAQSKPQTLTVSNGATSLHSYNNNDGAGDLKVGDCDWGAECNNIGVARAFFSFNISGLRNSSGAATVFDATVQAYQIHNAAACTAEPVNLYTAAAFTASTTFAQATYNTGIGTSTTNYSDSCSGHLAGYDSWSSATLTAQVQSMANSSNSWMTFGLKAPDEGDRNQYKRFDLNPLITVHYSHAPSDTAATGSSNFATCNGIHYSTQPYPYLGGSAQDNNSPHTPLVFRYYMYDAGGNQLADVDVPNITSSDGHDSATYTGHLYGTVPGNTYQYAVNAYVNSSDANAPAGTVGWGPLSSKYSFVAAWQAPTTKPIIGSLDFPANTWGNPTGSVRLRDDDPNAVGFSYAFDTGAPPTPNTCGNYSNADHTSGWILDSNGFATVPVPTALGVGRHTLDVRAFNGAHLLAGSSYDANYTFLVSPNTSAGTSNVVEAENGSRLSFFATSGDTATTMVDLSRWANASDRASVAGPASITGSTRQAGLGRIFTSAVAGVNLTTLYDCTASGDRVTSISPTCSGQTVNGTLGYVFATQPSGAGAPITKPLYRCHVGSDHFDTNSSTCEGIAGAVQDAALGWALAPIDSASSPLDSAFLSAEGGEFLNLRNAGSQFSMTFIAPVEADYAISAGMVKGPNDGTIQYSIADSAHPASQTDLRTLNGYSSTATETPALIGGIHLAANETYILTGTAQGATAGFDAELDYVSIAPINNVAGKPNDIGITADGTTPANAGLNPAPTSSTGPTQVLDTLSQDALESAGYLPGQEFTASDGASVFAFSRDTNGYDNLSADGSTIALNTPISSGNEIDLLVLSAGGIIPSNTDYVSVNYRSGTYQSGGIPAVPDWRSAAATPSGVGNATIEPVLSLDHYNKRDSSGNLATQQGNVELYMLRIALATPATTTDPVVSVSIPFPTDDPTVGQLHILGIGAAQPSQCGPAPC